MDEDPSPTRFGRPVSSVKAARSEHALAFPLAEVALIGPRHPQHLGSLRLVSPEAFPGPAERRDWFPVARGAGQHLGQKAAGSMIQSITTPESGPSEFAHMSVSRDHYLLLVCPHCFRSKWVLKRDVILTLEEVLNTFWEFECPVHGPLREKPLQASEKKPVVGDEQE